jgi:enoyl-CoA hydratase
MSESLLLKTRHDAVLQITINRPDKLNALNSATLDALAVAFAEVAAADAIREAVLTGAGRKAIDAGADIAEMSGLTPTQGRYFSHRGSRMMLCIEK